jgi:hypothetical protein
MSRAKILCRTPSVLFLVVSVGALAYACADPHGDLSDFETRSEDAKKAGTSGTGGAGGAAGTGGAAGMGEGPGFYDLTGQFVFSCVTQLTTVDQQLRFVANVGVTPTGAGGASGGTLNATLKAVLTTGKTTADSDLTGGLLEANGPSTVDAKGEFTLSFASVDIPSDASPLGRDITLSDVAFKGATQSADLFCIRLRTTITKPVNESLLYEAVDKRTGLPANVCAGLRIGDDGKLPVLTAALFNQCATVTKDLPAPP